MKRTPEEFEKLIHRTLRSVPDRRAPRSLESRVLAAIEARNSLPWWKQSYARWPLAARCVFLVVSGILANVALLATVWVFGSFDTAVLSNAFSEPLARLHQVGDFFTGISSFIALVVRNIPSTWLYGGLACLAILYSALFGIGATAYRTLYANR